MNEPVKNDRIQLAGELRAAIHAWLREGRRARAGLYQLLPAFLRIKP